MKKFSILAALVIVLFAACNKNKSTEQESLSEPEFNTAVASRKFCASYDVLQEQLKADPGLQKKMDDIESFTKKVIANPAAFKVLSDGTLELPVRVNILYNTSAQNISEAQIQSQIDVLNKDFAGTNTDYNTTPSIFQSVRSGDIKIRFLWTPANTTRKFSSKTSWGTRDAMKSSRKGGIDPTSPTTTLNIWVCVIGNGILGYAQFPGGSSSTDGIVIDPRYFGTTGLAIAPFNLGRTATHEVGHYFNLRHIWGDATCGNDFVGDTPPHRTANYSCPNTINITCTNNTSFNREMTMNYMDYTDDACMYMFTLGQASRMKATYAVGGPRASLIP
jgi:hypothetical protein